MAQKRSNINDLPQWAQDRIIGLEAEAASYKQALNKYLNDTAPTQIAVIDHVTDAHGAVTEVRRWVHGLRVEVYGAGVRIDVMEPPFTDSGEQS